MASFAKKSMSQLMSCERDIQTIFQEVVKYADCSIIEGHRSAERQHEHWKKGRKLTRPANDPKKAESWKVLEKKKIVTHKDGYTKKSRHQGYPSPAVDVVPYPEMWSSKDAFQRLIGVVNWVQDRLYEEGKIQRKLDNGYDLWNGFDSPHWQTKS